MRVTARTLGVALAAVVVFAVVASWAAAEVSDGLDSRDQGTEPLAVAAYSPADVAVLGTAAGATRERSGPRSDLLPHLVACVAAAIVAASAVGARRAPWQWDVPLSGAVLCGADSARAPPPAVAS